MLEKEKERDQHSFDNPITKGIKNELVISLKLLDKMNGSFFLSLQ